MEKNRTVESGRPARDSPSRVSPTTAMTASTTFWNPRYSESFLPNIASSLLLAPMLLKASMVCQDNLNVESRPMGERSYGQFCGLVRALEMVGERWALLIVRDLLVGPRRFSDLRRGLPRIPTNVLTTRLKELEEA